MSDLQQSVADELIRLRSDNEALQDALAVARDHVAAVSPSRHVAAQLREQLDEQQYQLLSRIAPVIVSDVPMFQSDSWERETRLFAKALGREEAQLVRNALLGASRGRPEEANGGSSFLLLLLFLFLFLLLLLILLLFLPPLLFLL